MGGGGWGEGGPCGRAVRVLGCMTCANANIFGNGMTACGHIKFLLGNLFKIWSKINKCLLNFTVPAMAFSSGIHSARLNNIVVVRNAKNLQTSNVSIRNFEKQRSGQRDAVECVWWMSQSRWIRRFIQ